MHIYTQYNHKVFANEWDVETGTVFRISEVSLWVSNVCVFCKKKGGKGRLAY